MFLDASAIVAILTEEAEAGSFVMRLSAVERRLTSALALYEASQAVARKQSCGIKAAAAIVDEFVADSDIHVVPIAEAELHAAIDAFDRFGKGRHSARLNMGDCFAYAYACTHNVPLLFKGDDFSQTDIAQA